MKNTVLLTACCIFFCAAPAFADTGIKAEVDKTALSTDETLIYKIVVTSSEDKIPAPQIAKFEGFKVVSQAESSTLSFVDKKIKTILVYAFVLMPLDKGRLKIEPSVIKLRDKTHSTEAFEIEVSQGKARPDMPPERKPSLPKEPALGAGGMETTL